MMKQSKQYTNRSVHWATPSNIYKHFLDLGYIDPCPLHCDTNCLNKNYHNERLFINPPFTDLDMFSNWIISQIINGCNIILLMPCRTDTKYFARLYPYIYKIRFFNKRLKFGDSDKSAPFPTMLVYLGDIPLVKVFDVVNENLEVIRYEKSK